MKKIKTSNSKKNAAQSLKDLQNPKFIAKPVILPNIVGKQKKAQSIPKSVVRERSR